MGRPAYASASANIKPRGKKGPRNVPARQVVRGSEYLQELIEAYLIPEETDKTVAMQEQCDDAMTEGLKGNITSSRSSSSSTGLEIDCCKNHKVGKNQSDQCKRKRRGIDCVHGFCFQCCLDTPIDPKNNYTYCSGHYPQKLKKELEDRYIEEGLNRKLRDRSKFFSYEERFTDTQQTVTIWCSSDFYAYKSCCAEAMADVAKSERRQEATRRRRLNANASASVGGAGAGAAYSFPLAASGSERAPMTASGADKLVASAMAKAWCMVRENEVRDRHARWENRQKLWLEEQKRLGVQSTSWILGAREETGGEGATSPFSRKRPSPAPPAAPPAAAGGTLLYGSGGSSTNIKSFKRSRQ